MGEELEKQIVSLLTGHGVSRIAVFGSYARGEEGPESDLDLLVNFQKDLSLLTLIQIEQDLSARLGIKVDLVTEGALSPYIRERIEKDLRVIYQ